MAPPPSQAGKFKPRKATKKVPIAAPGEAAGAAAAPAAAGSNNDQRASSGAGGAGGGRGGGRGRGAGGRGRGREDGRGRGRGRGPQPQGQVFFTAGAGGGASGSSSGPKNTLASKVKAARAANAAKANANANAAMARATGAVQVKRENESQEEVVGTMEEGVGFAAQNVEAARKIKEEADRNNGEFELEDNTVMPSRATTASLKKGHGMETFQYDSDSSKEEAAASSRHKGFQRNKKVPPLVLPYPKSSASVGTGGTLRPVFYPGEGYNLVPDKDNVAPTKYAHMTAPVITVDSVGMSPFVDIANTDSLRVEENSWFLVQLPTRLPLVTQESDDTNKVGNNDEENGPMDVADAPQPQQPTAAKPDVRNASVQTESFDNALSSAKPGRIGRMLVYKSGKTVLILEGTHIGDPPVRLNVTEGLTCGFRQQAVAIDTNESEFVALGDVQKTIVATPNLDGAFAA